MAQCSTKISGTTSHQPYDLLTNDQGHDLHIGLDGLELGVLTWQRLGYQSRGT